MHKINPVVSHLTVSHKSKNPSPKIEVWLLFKFFFCCCWRYFLYLVFYLLVWVFFYNKNPPNISKESPLRAVSTVLFFNFYLFVSKIHKLPQFSHKMVAYLSLKVLRCKKAQVMLCFTPPSSLEHLWNILA